MALKRQERWPLSINMEMRVMQSRACAATGVAMFVIQGSVLTASILYMLGIDEGPAVQVVIHEPPSYIQHDNFQLPLFSLRSMLYRLAFLCS